MGASTSFMFLKYDEHLSPVFLFPRETKYSQLVSPKTLLLSVVEDMIYKAVAPDELDVVEPAVGQPAVGSAVGGVRVGSLLVLSTTMNLAQRATVKR